MRCFRQSDGRLTHSLDMELAWSLIKGVRFNSWNIFSAASKPLRKLGANAKALAMDTVPIIKDWETLKVNFVVPKIPDNPKELTCRLSRNSFLHF